jgi:hypothetical protein
MLVSRPPFTACSTTDRPFLARLILEWVGGQNHALEVDHWVEVRPTIQAIPMRVITHYLFFQSLIS